MFETYFRSELMSKIGDAVEKIEDIVDTILEPDDIEDVSDIVFYSIFR